MNVMAMYQYEVEFRVRKGAGPDFFTKFVPVAFDDVDPEVPEYIVKEWAKAEAESELRKHDCPVFIYVDTHSS